MRSRRPLALPRVLAVTPVLALCLVHTVRAEEPISTDRPDFVESSDVVGKGRFQLETGFSSERNKADGVKERLTTTPTLLLPSR